MLATRIRNLPRTAWCMDTSDTHTHGSTIHTYKKQDSVDTVEELLKKQEDFEKTLAAQEEKFSTLTRETKVHVTVTSPSHHPYTCDSKLGTSVWLCMHVFKVPVLHSDN